MSRFQLSADPGSPTAAPAVNPSDSSRASDPARLRCAHPRASPGFGHGGKAVGRIFGPWAGRGPRRRARPRRIRRLAERVAPHRPGRRRLGGVVPTAARLVERRYGHLMGAGDARPDPARMSPADPGCARALRRPHRRRPTPPRRRPARTEPPGAYPPTGMASRSPSSRRARSDAPDLVDSASFEAERFTWTAPDRLELSGVWSGVRGLRFLRPTLTLQSKQGERRLLALLEHKPWAAADGATWVAAFPWNGPPETFDAAELSVGSGLDVALDPPATGAADVPTRARRTAGSATRAARSAASAAVSTLTPGDAEDGRLRAELEHLRGVVAKAHRAAEHEAALRRQSHEVAVRDAARIERKLRAATEARDAAVVARDAARAAAESATGERDAAVAAREEAIAASDAATARAESLAGELDGVRSELAEGHRALDEARAAMEELERELAAARATGDEYRARLGTAPEELDTLRAQLAEAVAERDAAQRDMRTTRGERDA